MYEKRGTSWSHLFADKPTLLLFLPNKRPEWNAPTSHIEGEGLLLRLGATWGNMREIAERVSDTIQPLQLSEGAFRLALSSGDISYKGGWLNRFVGYRL